MVSYIGTHEDILRMHTLLLSLNVAHTHQEHRDNAVITVEEACEQLNDNDSILVVTYSQQPIEDD